MCHALPRAPICAEKRACAAGQCKEKQSRMDLTATPQQEDLRTELRSWLVTNLPWEYGSGLPPRFDDLEEEVAFGRDWQARLAGAGWVGVTWPADYGGRGLGPVDNFVVQEEPARTRA